MNTSPRELLATMFDEAVKAAQPEHCIPRFLPKAPQGRTVVIGAGKASAAMAQALERHWTGPLTGLVVTRYGYAVPCTRIEIIEASHPVPDAAGLEAAKRMLDPIPLTALDANGRITASDYQPKQVATTENATLTTDQRDALKLFSEKNGQAWKDKLNLAWSSGSYKGLDGSQSALLQQVRNQFGPEWLVKLKTDDLYPEAVQQPTVSKARPRAKAKAQAL